MNRILTPPPRLETPRLILRSFLPQDAPALARLAGRREIADTTLAIPHPYTESHAREFIREQAGLRTLGKALAFAIELRTEREVIGAVGFKDIDHEHEQAELGFWIGVDLWGQGYATEAGRALLLYGFQSLGLNRVHAHHMVKNPASGRVLKKLGMQHEGTLRQRIKKREVFEDVILMAILREDWR
jgi:RimJ/RimL family protein N-acetyltransferase